MMRHVVLLVVLYSLSFLFAVLATEESSSKHNEEISSVRRLMELSLNAVDDQQQMNDLKDDWREILNKYEGLLGRNGEIETLLTEVFDDKETRKKILDREEAHEFEDPSYYADRHLHQVLKTYNDFDCLEREFDVSSIDVDEAIAVFEKCHILVLRNVFPRSEVQALHGNFSQYIGDVYAGTIRNKRGMATTYGGDSMVLVEGSEKRWNILPPRNLVTPNIYANPVLLQILSSSTLLGGEDDMVVNHIGNINAEVGAPAQGWHADGTYLHGEESLRNWGVAGHDLPPYAVNMFTPLVDMSSELGPTEFCVGTSNLRGLDGSFYNVLDDHLLHNPAVSRLREFDRRPGSCPTGFQRTPLLRMGDAVLVDYLVTHRGGANNGDHLRSLLFITYSRKWYHDSNFDITDEDEEGAADSTAAKWLTQWTRFAVVEKETIPGSACPNGSHDYDSSETCRVQEVTPLEYISNFVEAYDRWHSNED